MFRNDAGFHLRRIMLVACFLFGLTAAGCRDETPVTAPEETSTGALSADWRDELAAAIRGEGGALPSTEAAKRITGPTVITEAGRYRVSRNFSVSAGDAIVIRASFVFLSLDDHTITGPGHKEGRGIVVDGVDHVLVREGRLKRFGTGVALLGANDCAVKELEIEGGDEFADPPTVPPQIGILLVDSRENWIRHNEIERVNLGLFIRGGGSHDNRIRSNEVRGGLHGLLAICYNPAEGAGPAGPHDDLVAKNLLQRFDTGIVTSVGSASNAFRSNRILYFTTAWRDVNGTNLFVNNRARQIER